MSDKELEEYIKRFKQRNDELSKDKNKLNDFFISAGIINEKGELTEPYKS